MSRKKKYGYYAAAAALLLAIAGMLFLILPEKHAETENTQQFDWDTVDVVVQDTDSAFVKEEVTLSSETLEKEIRGVGLLVTADYHYRHAESFENTLKAIGIKWDFTKTSFIFMIDGDISAGIDLDQVKVEVNNSSKIITIKLPEAQITSSEIHHDTFEEVESKTGLFNKLTPEQVNQSFAHVKEVEEKKAIDDGILDRAGDNAERIIESMLINSLKLNDYTIEFTK